MYDCIMAVSHSRDAHCADSPPHTHNPPRSTTCPPIHLPTRPRTTFCPAIQQDLDMLLAQNKGKPPMTMQVIYIYI